MKLSFRFFAIEFRRLVTLTPFAVAWQQQMLRSWAWKTQRSQLRLVDDSLRSPRVEVSNNQNSIIKNEQRPHRFISEMRMQQNFLEKNIYTTQKHGSCGTLEWPLYIQNPQTSYCVGKWHVREHFGNCQTFTRRKGDCAKLGHFKSETFDSNTAGAIPVW